MTRLRVSVEQVCYDLCSVLYLSSINRLNFQHAVMECNTRVVHALKTSKEIRGFPELQVTYCWLLPLSKFELVRNRSLNQISKDFTDEE